MSAIAEFIRLPRTALDGLDMNHENLRQRGEHVVDYPWSGYVLGTLLPYLEEKQQIDLMKSEYEPLAESLTAASGSSHFIFTNSLRTRYLAKLEALAVSEEQLRDYYNEFNETNESQAGRPMFDGLRALREALSHVDDSSVVVLRIS